MNRNLGRLAGIAEKPSRTIIGLMSGTSLDGLDIALCDVMNSGSNISLQLRAFTTMEYPSFVRSEIRKVFAKPTVDLQLLCLLNAWLGDLHAGYINDFLTSRKIDKSAVDLIASHGQTIFHSPRILHGLAEYPNATLQIGDGDHIAVKTGIITVSDFRQKHIAGGGEGAPLAMYGDYFLFSKHGEDRVMLNLGGIANFTYLPGDLDTQCVIVTDTGPGNTMIDAYVRANFNVEFDRDALLAKQGIIDEILLEELQQNEFFQKSIPKTTGPELFNQAYLERAIVQSGRSGLSPYDILATVTRFSAVSIADTIKALIPEIKGTAFYCSGGGAHNPLLIEDMRKYLDGIAIRRTDELGIPGDAKEAILFAVLANETIAGEPLAFGRTGINALSLGKISFPS